MSLSRSSSAWWKFSAAPGMNVLSRVFAVARFRPPSLLEVEERRALPVSMSWEGLVTARRRAARCVESYTHDGVDHALEDVQGRFGRH